MYPEMDGSDRKQLIPTSKKAKQKCKEETMQFEISSFLYKFIFLTFLKFEFQTCALPRNNYNILDYFFYHSPYTQQTFWVPIALLFQFVSFYLTIIKQFITFLHCHCTSCQSKYSIIYINTHRIKNKQQHSKKPKQMLKDLIAFCYIEIHHSPQNLLKCKPASLSILQEI